MAALHALASPVQLASALPPVPGGAANATARPDPTTDLIGPNRIGPNLIGPNLKSKAHAAAVNFETQFLNSMFSQMLAGIQGDGPFGGGNAVGVWRSFLSEQYAKSFAKAGGIGIADHVYHALLAQQEAH